ncbi:MAG TPA: hypothetical protein VE913_05435 [Longimicrobium sp.]|nr:hypothetical protein [Longimicrobium sp.]
MASNGGDDPLARLREAVGRQVALRSLRLAARQVGMSPSGLSNFLDGTPPTGATSRKLEAWLAACAPPAHAHSAESALAVLRVLTHELHPRRQAEALVRLLSVLERAYTAAGARPAWLDEAVRRARHLAPCDFPSDRFPE